LLFLNWSILVFIQRENICYKLHNFCKLG
jgi:hypothetical protein